MQWNEESHVLGVADMDHEHQKFCVEHEQILKAGKEEFASLLQQLYEHTQVHFSQEEEWMLACNFSSYAEHKSEHDRVLGELNLFAQKAKNGNTMMAKAYVKDRLPEWFTLHLSTMDSALAQKMKETGTA